ncbi:MAG: type II secretion system F family protein [Candidatus Thermoplasmatota archaeon]
MRSSKYSRFCRQLFQKTFEHFDISKTTKNRMLEKADITMEYTEYYSMVLMNLIIGFICSFIPTVILYLIFPHWITSLLILVVTSLVSVGTGLYYLILPKAKAKARGKNIDKYLPYATNFINTMSYAGISPAEIFEALSTVDLYGEIQKEANKINTEINMMGIDVNTALNNAIKISPSDKFKEFIQGMLGVIQSGSDLAPYLNRCVKEYMQSDLIDRKRNLESLAVMAESFVVTVIAFPLFLVIILSIMGMTSGGISYEFMYILAFLILPLAYFGFYVMMKSGMGESV